MGKLHQEGPGIPQNLKVRLLRRFLLLQEGAEEAAGVEEAEGVGVEGVSGVVGLDLMPVIFSAACSAVIMMMDCVFPVGRSGWMEASTTNKLSVP